MKIKTFNKRANRTVRIEFYEYDEDGSRVDSRRPVATSEIRYGSREAAQKMAAYLSHRGLSEGSGPHMTPIQMENALYDAAEAGLINRDSPQFEGVLHTIQEAACAATKGE